MAILSISSSSINCKSKRMSLRHVQRVLRVESMKFLVVCVGRETHHKYPKAGNKTRTCLFLCCSSRESLSGLCCLWDRGNIDFEISQLFLNTGSLRRYFCRVNFFLCLLSPPNGWFRSPFQIVFILANSLSTANPSLTVGISPELC
jgi:hypothetical protein